MYAASADAALEDRAYLHAAALRIPRLEGSAALCDEHASPIEVVCPPEQGAEFVSAAFCEQWRDWFPQQRPHEGEDGDGGAGSDGEGDWFRETPVRSLLRGG